MVCTVTAGLLLLISSAQTQETAPRASISHFGREGIEPVLRTSSSMIIGAQYRYRRLEFQGRLFEADEVHLALGFHSWGELFYSFQDALVVGRSRRIRVNGTQHDVGFKVVLRSQEGSWPALSGMLHLWMADASVTVQSSDGSTGLVLPPRFTALVLEKLASWGFGRQNAYLEGLLAIGSVQPIHPLTFSFTLGYDWWIIPRWVVIGGNAGYSYEYVGRNRLRSFLFSLFLRSQWRGLSIDASVMLAVDGAPAVGSPFSGLAVFGDLPIFAPNETLRRFQDASVGALSVGVSYVLEL